MKKTNLVKKIRNISFGIGTAFIISGCANFGPQRVNLTETNNYKGTSAQYFAYSSDKETLLDGAETDRERRCLNKINEFKYKTKEEAYKNLSSCVNYEKNKDIAIWGIGSVLIDGLKLYGLVNGLSGGKVSSSSNPSNTSNYQTIGTPSKGSTLIWSPIK